MTLPVPPRELLDDRADPDSRSVLADWYLERGIAEPRLGSALVVVDVDDFASDSAADFFADSADDDDAVSTSAASSVADDDAADNLADLAHDDGRTVVVEEQTRWIAGEIDMREGLKIVKLPGGYYGRSVTRVGWLRRVSGDEWELLPGARSVWRTGGAMTPLDQLAAHGPGDNHQVSDPQAGIEEIHRLLLRRCLPADESAWAAHCPRPPRFEK